MGYYLGIEILRRYGWHWYKGVRNTANQSLTENLGPNGRIGRKTQKLLTITNQKIF